MKLSVLLILIAMISTSFTVLGNVNSSIQPSPTSVTSHIPLHGSNYTLNSDYTGPRLSVPVAPETVSNEGNIHYNGTVNVLVTFTLSNQSKLSAFLAELSNPSSQYYHKYITRKQFESRYGVSNSTFNEAVNYFSNFNDIRVTSYADHVSLSIRGPASQVSRAFNTTIVSNGNGSYSANSMPTLPSPIGSEVSFVAGLSNAKMNVSLNLNYGASSSLNPQLDSSGYPSLGSDSHIAYGSNMQVAYNEQALLNRTYPTKEVVATILWAGYNKTYQDVGPFVPSDIYNYFNATLPSYEPHSSVYGVPVNGALKPGLNAYQDITGANYENTLDLEMIGSTAPGSSIYNVYGQNGTVLSTDTAFAKILNPNSTFSALNNVSVISNSWGSGDNNNTAWVTYLEEAQTRGITVLASSGDSGDNPKSLHNTGGPDYVSFPSTMEYNNFGITAVGGTTVLLSSSSKLLNQTAWYESYNYTGGNPAGSTGGISSIFNETNWQLNSLANNVIQGQGLGVPDIAAIANDTKIYITVPSGTTGSISGYTLLGGTSVASPIEAGIVAELNAVLNMSNKPNLGYLNPLLYSLADNQFSGSNSPSSSGITPFDNVHTGRNHVYQAVYPYNLVTGWGSINAYDFYQAINNAYNVTFYETGLPAGTGWKVEIDNGASANSTSANLTISLINGTYSYIASPVFNKYSDISGSFTVNGTGESLNLVFTLRNFTVNMTETGLPAGNWYVNLSQKAGSAPYGKPISFTLPYGNYSYTVQTDYKNYSPVPGYGNFTVKGSNIAVTNIAFAPVLYNITFSASGLPAGTQWGVLFNGKSYHSNSTNYSRITVYSTNGTYYYNAFNGSNYYSREWSTQTLTVNGKGENVSVSFIKFSRITGIISPTGAILSVNGVEYQPAANGSYTVELTAGNYSVKVSDSGYVTQYYNVTLLTGTVAYKNFTLSQVPVINPGGPRSSFLGGTNYNLYVIGGVIGIILIGVALGLRRKR